VLLNHIVDGNFSAKDVEAAVEEANPDPFQLQTFLNKTLEVTASGSGLIVTPFNTSLNATIVMVDVVTCAGIVHVVDTLLVPDIVPDTPVNVILPSSPPQTPPVNSSPVSSPPTTSVPADNSPSAQTPNSAFTASAVSGFLGLVITVLLVY
jgi:hypothetical protein